MLPCITNLGPYRNPYLILWSCTSIYGDKISYWEAWELGAVPSRIIVSKEVINNVHS